MISEWIVRFALNADKPLGAKEQAVYCSTWEEGFSDVDAGRLKAAFIACLRSHTYKTIPTIGDIRQHLTKAEEDANTLSAENKWQQILDFIRVFYSPDLGIDRRAPRIGERTMAAIRAAGGMQWINECDRDQLVWCKKAFIESYLAWERLEKGQHLLPDGELKNLLAETAERVSVARLLEMPRPVAPQAVGPGLALPPEPGKEYPKPTKFSNSPISPEEKLAVADALAAEARAVIERHRVERVTVTVSNEDRDALRHQAEIIRARYPKIGNLDGIPPELLPSEKTSP